jgi:integrase
MEAPMRLTAQALANHRPPDKSDYIVFDDDIAGFGLRFREGRRSWVFQYAIGSGAGRITRRIKIGDYPALSPAKAREEAANLHAKVHLHGDPAVERRKNRAEANNTFGSLVDRYLDFKRGRLRPRTFSEMRRHLLVQAKPLHNLPLAAVDQRAIAQRLDTTARAGAVTANRLRASLSSMFVWAMRQGLAVANPVVNTSRHPELSRDRVLSGDELRAIWHALRDDDFGVILKLLMLTAQRREEIGGLRWSEIDFERGVISIAGARTKNARPHSIPMSPTVTALLQARPRTEREPVFGRGSGPFGGWSAAKAALDARTGPLKHWTIHDLRRTVATGMADIGIQPHIIEAVLNHVSGHRGGIAGIYNRAQYAAEKAQALARWDEHLRGVVGMRGRP